MSERLWAPWRFEYVQDADAKNKGGCIFCVLPGEDNDRDNLLLFRGKSAFVMLNAFPYTSGHLMVSPFRHVGEMGGLNDEELLEINQLVKRCCEWVSKVYNPEGFNIGVNIGRAGGAGIPGHIHWHIVPRWAGDTNYMTTVADVRVIPQDLRTSWDLLAGVVEGKK
ncbi:MAG: HIT domain-containing protein [Armatimonadetes bacterium]|nr:HIT domain-containing protein [Armatimonadota bacterium]